jgi:hypothetical protein
VLLTDQEAEHIPGCNMAFYKSALESVGLFDPQFRKAGDDVDLCWRLLDNNLKIRFSPAGFVWHYRRSTLKAYARQQAGYGEAEALLIGKHPEHYSAFGGGIWRGRIYSSALPGLLLRRATIYHGIFGSGFFQKLYAPSFVPPFVHCTSLAYQVFINLPLLALAINFLAFVPLAVVSLGITVGTCIVAGIQATIPRQKRRAWSRPLVALMFLLQPIIRDWSRFKARLQVRAGRARAEPTPAALRPQEIPEVICFWSAGGLERFKFLEELIARLEAAGWAFRLDTGWSPYDLEITPWAWSRLRFTTVREELAQGKQSFRCRLESRWSIPAWLVMGLLAAAVVSLVAGLARQIPWVWFSAVSLPLLWWFFADADREHRRELAGLAKAVASKQSMIELDPMP